MLDYMQALDLFQSIIEDDKNEEENKKEDNICLISNTLLEDNYIKLECNHRFNYLPLYYEIVEQKTKKILDNYKLRIEQIKCPYCRNVSNFILPYYKYYNIKNIKGVTSPFKLSVSLYRCEYIDKKNICNEDACITRNGIFCNKHYKNNYFYDNFLCKMDKNKFNLEYEKYNKMNLKELKLILKELNLKKTGNKKDIIERIIVNKNM